jgi:hypothetical protein
MKHGLIAWDREQLPPAVFETRLARARAALAERNLPALLVYTDVWRSNQGRFLTNFMPYWNRSLIVIPVDAPPVLLCALSPRVYPWIKSVTIFEDIRPAGKLTHTLDQLCAERQWLRIGVLDLPKLPFEIHAGLRKLEMVDVPSAGIVDPDDAEFAMRRRAVALARQVLEARVADADGTVGHPFVGRLEREFRLAGAEDLVIRLRPRGAGAYSVAVALEYCGHWVKVTRAHASPEDVAALRDRFGESLASGGGYRENLAGRQPYEPGPGPIFALQVEHQGLYYGDTCAGNQPL